jgi:DNA-binding SARP family transcriptional activator
LLNLRTLGSLRLTSSDGEEITPVLSQPKRLALLVYLAVAKPGELLRRDTLLSLFWPERDDAHARNALSQGLSFLRRNLSEGVFLGRGTEEVGLAPGQLRVDTEEFDSAIQEERWSDALSLYGGGFLEGFHIADAWGFGEWVEEEREKRREMAAGAAWSMAQDHIDRNNLVEAERTAQRALSLVWSDETPVQVFIRSMAEAGDRAAALSFYEKFSSKLREELELEPSSTTQRVAEAIRRGEIRAPVTAPGRDQDSPRETTVTGPPGVSSRVTDPNPNQTAGPWKLWFWSLVFAATVCFAAVGIFRLRWGWSDPGPPPPDRPFTVLADVAGSASLEDRDCVGFLLQTGLDVAHVVQTVPEAEVVRVLDLMERNPETPFTPHLAQG